MDSSKGGSFILTEEPLYRAKEYAIVNMTVRNNVMAVALKNSHILRKVDLNDKYISPEGMLDYIQHSTSVRN